VSDLQRLLLLCARQEFLPEHREAVERLGARRRPAWPRLLAVAEARGLLPMVAANLEPGAL
jgi:hypothetical protein